MRNNVELTQSAQPETQQNFPHLFTKFIERLSQKWDSLSPEKKVYFTQLGLMMAVQVADTMTTYAAFETVPGLTEAFPIAGFFLDKGGMVALGIAKIGAAAGGITAVEIVRNKMIRGETTPAINNILRFWNSVNTAVSVNNAIHLIIMK